VRSTPCTWTRETWVSWLSLKTKVDGFLQFGLKTGGDGFLRFDLKTGGDGLTGLGLKTGSTALVIWSSKSP
jgi:hypothetical protein